MNPGKGAILRTSLLSTPLPCSPPNDAALRLRLNGLISANASRCDTAPIAATISAKVTQNLTMWRSFPLDVLRVAANPFTPVACSTGT
jgi:hypothetical protein